MLLSVLTFAHVAISLIGIGTGLIVMAGFLADKQSYRWTAWFLWSTVLTSVTGYFFPFHGFKPSYVVGAISLVFLAFALFALYQRQLSGGWRTTYVISAMISLYLNVFVLIAQLFLKVPALKTLAPTQSEPPFKLTQLAALVVFFLLTLLSTARFRSAERRAV